MADNDNTLPAPMAETAQPPSVTQRALRRHAQTQSDLAVAEERVARLRRREESQRRTIEGPREAPQSDVPTPRPPDGYVHQHPEGESQFWEAHIHGTDAGRTDNCWRVDRLVSEEYCTPVWYSTVPTDERVVPPGSSS